jgi:hypothetical protein
MMLYRSVTDSEVPPTEQEMAEMGRFIGEMASSGKLLATDGLLSSARGSRVRISDGAFTVTDGPFTESKEIIGGFAIVQVDSKDEAIELAKRFLEVIGEGESEIREMVDDPAYAAP